MIIVGDVITLLLVIAGMAAGLTVLAVIADAALARSTDDLPDFTEDGDTDDRHH